MYMRYTLLIIALSIPVFGHAQAPNILWTKIYGGSEVDMAYSIQPTSDGGFVVVGGTLSFGAGNNDIWLVKLDALGDTVWTHTYGGAGSESGKSVEVTADGGYIVAGYVDITGGGNYRVYLMRTDENGYVLWTNTYGGSSADLGYSVKTTSDGGYIVVGETRLLGTPDVYLVKVDSLGNPVWFRIHGGLQAEEGRCIQVTHDGGFVIAGNTAEDAFLLVTDANGDTVWTQTYAGPNTDCFFSVVQTNDSGYVAVGATGSITAPDYDLYVVRTNEYGDILWTRTYGSSSHDYGFSVSAAHNGFIITGFYGWAPLFYSCELYLLRIDDNGDEIWSMTIPCGSECHGQSVKVTMDGGYVVAGWTSSYMYTDIDFVIIRTDEDTCYIQEQGNHEAGNLLLKILPNPFCHHADIRWQITDDSQNTCDGRAEIRIYDASGKLVKQFAQLLFTGYQASVQWDGRDDSNMVLAGGVYFVALRVGHYTATEKLLLIR